MAYIRRRKDTGNYVIGFRDQHGRWHEKTAGPRRKDAEVLLRRVLREVAEGTYGKRDENPTLAEFSDYFLRARAGEVKASTLEDYGRVMSLHVLPRLGKFRLREITPAAVQGLLLDLEGEGMSAAMRGKVLRYLKVLLRLAVRLELIERDPCRAARAPKVERKEPRFFTSEEVSCLLEAAEGYMKPLLAAACYAGLRQGELLALRWGDIDLFGGTITVTRTYHYAHGFSSPKTPASRRTVPIIPTLRAILEDYRREQFGALEPDPERLVFLNQAGNPIDRRNLVNRGFRRALEAAGLPEIRFHDLRHTFASLCIEGGVDPKTLQALLGHSSIKVTMDTYSHLYQTAFDRASRALEAVASGGAKVIRMPRKEGEGDPR